MSAAPLLHDERERLETLGRYAILDTLPEQQFDDLTFLAAQICGTPISLLSLVDRDRQWFKSHYGLDATETPRAVSFCAHAILQSGVMEVPDARQDPRFFDNSLVTAEPDIRYYAGAPLVTPEGFRLGTLCVIDTKPHNLSRQQLQSLEALARQAVSQMEMWRNNRQLEIASVERSIALQVAHQTADRLAQSEARFRQFMDNSPVMAFIKNAEGRFVYVNEPMEETFQTPRDYLLGKNDFDWLPHHVATTVRANDVQVLESMETAQLIEMVPTSDGKEHEWLVFKFPIPEASGEVFLGGVALDITEQRRIERLKSEFVSVVSHELRTPLTSIRGALGLLAGGVAGELSERARQMIDIAQKNGDRLVLLINDILDVEKIESGKMRFDWHEVEVAALLQNAVEINAAYAQAGDARFELDLADLGAKTEVLGDESRLQQVLSNLLSNAVKFTPPGGVVHLKAESLPSPASQNPASQNPASQKPASQNPASQKPASAKPATDWVRVTVRDDGPGVPDEFVSRLFEKFAQADSSSTRKQGGTGLGLAIARAIVEKHGGFLRYVAPTAPATGAIFAFDLPLHRAPEATGESTDEPNSEATGESSDKIRNEVETAASARRILICEDDAEVAENLRAMALQSGYEADIASSVAQARRQLARRNYAGMTLDLMFSDGDGLELLAAVRAGQTPNSPGNGVGHEGGREAQKSASPRDLPVVIVSASSRNGRLEGEAFEVLDWLQKPIDAARLRAALAQFQRDAAALPDPNLASNRDETPRKTLMGARPRLLHVEDDADVRQVMAAILGDQVEVVAATSVSRAQEHLANGHFDLAILDISLPDGSGLDLLAQLAASEPPVPVILFCADEVNAEQAQWVAASMIKSRTDNQELRNVIWRCLQGE